MTFLRLFAFYRRGGMTRRNALRRAFERARALRNWSAPL